MTEADVYDTITCGIVSILSLLHYRVYPVNRLFLPKA